MINTIPMIFNWQGIGRYGKIADETSPHPEAQMQQLSDESDFMFEYTFAEAQRTAFELEIALGAPIFEASLTSGGGARDRGCHQ